MNLKVAKLSLNNAFKPSVICHRLCQKSAHTNTKSTQLIKTTQKNFVLQKYMLCLFFTRKMSSYRKIRFKVLNLSPNNPSKPSVTCHRLCQMCVRTTINHTQFTKTTHKCIIISYTRVTRMVRKVSTCVIWAFPVHPPPSKVYGVCVCVWGGGGGVGVGVCVCA